jgi:hypothetical protein
VQILKTRGESPAFKLGERAKLARRFAFNPCAR